MTDDDRRQAALVLLDMPLFHELWAELEASAVNMCINAAITDDAARAAWAAEARAIRSFRSKLRVLAQGTQSGKSAPV